jgi:hypothetical protein
MWMDHSTSADNTGWWASQQLQLLDYHQQGCSITSWWRDQWHSSMCPLPTSYACQL